jgi:hypothetical protein
MDSPKISRESRESTPAATTTTPATSVHSSTPARNDIKENRDNEIPSTGIITEEMIKEESDLHNSSQHNNEIESSSQVFFLSE